MNTSFVRASLLALLSLTLPAQVYSPRVLLRGQPDSTDLKSLAQGIIQGAGARTDREKAEAIWRFFLTDGRFVKPGFWYHIAGWAYEEPMGEVLDPVKLFNSYGFGLCYQIAPALEAVFEAAGFDARAWFLTGHTVTEVFYDGGWHMYDSDMLGYTTVGEGDFRQLPVASVRQLEQDKNIIVGKLARPNKVRPGVVDTPWYPADVNASAMADYAETFASAADNRLYPYTRYPSGHSMDFVLRPGERLIRYYRPEGPGAYYLPFKDTGDARSEFPREIKDYAIRTADGPHSQKDGRLWGTGRLEYAPAGTISVGSTVFDMPSPYVIIDAAFSLEAALETAKDTVLVETSADAGRSWQTAGRLAGPHQGPWKTAPAVLAKGEHGLLTAVSGTYGYQVRFTLANTAVVKHVVLATRIQLNPRSLPELAAGKNELTYKAGPALRRYQIPVRANRATEFARKAENARFVAQGGQGYLLPERGKRAQFVFELSAPDGADLTGFDAGGRFLDLRDGLLPDKFTAETRKLETAAGGLKPFAQLAWSTSPDGEYKTLWSYDPNRREDVDRVLRWPEVDRSVRDLPAGTRKVYLRYQLEDMALDDFRMAAVARAAASSSPLEITHVWREQGQRKTHVEKIGGEAERHYTIEAAAGMSNEALILACPAK